MGMFGTSNGTVLNAVQQQSDSNFKELKYSQMMKER